MRVGGLVYVSVAGTYGNAVNQSTPRLRDTAGSIYNVIADPTVCSTGAQACNVSFNVPASRMPARVYIYTQGANNNNN